MCPCNVLVFGVDLEVLRWILDTYTIPKTYIAPENGGIRCYVSFSEGKFYISRTVLLALLLQIDGNQTTWKSCGFSLVAIDSDASHFMLNAFGTTTSF